MDTQCQGAVRQRRRCPPCQASGTPPAVSSAAPLTAPPASLLGSRWVCFPRISHAIPRPCVAPNIRIVGIAPFVEVVESSLNRIACETAPRMCARAHAGPLRRRLTAGRLTLVHPRARGPANSHDNPLMRAWAASPRRGIGGLRASSMRGRTPLSCPGYCGECLGPDWRFGMSGQRQYSMELRERATRMALEARADPY